MKTIIRIPTVQFGYLEFESDCTPEEAIFEHNRLIKLYNTSNEGLPHLEWNHALDGYLATNQMPSEVYEGLNDTQKGVIQEIKKSVKRITPKETRE